MPLQFLKSLLTLLAISLPVWILFRVIANVLKKRRGESISPGKESLLGLFFLYVVCVAAITIIPVPVSQFRDPTANDFNLIPIINTAREFMATLTPRTNYMTGHFLQNILGNIVLFIPLGMLLPLLSAKFRSLKTLMPAALICSLSIEVTQYVSKFFGSFRSVDIDDIILNTLGAFLGFIIFDKFLARFFQKAEAQA